jgi:hypothetical protein
LACTGNNDSVRTAAAIKRVDSYFVAFKSGIANDYLAFYDPAVFTAMSRDQWLETRKGWAVDLGEYESHKLLIAQANRPILGTGSPTVVLTYSVKYSRREAREIFTMRAAKDDAEPSIINHQVNWDPTKPPAK